MLFTSQEAEMPYVYNVNKHHAFETKKVQVFPFIINFDGQKILLSVSL